MEQAKDCSRKEKDSEGLKKIRIPHPINGYGIFTTRSFNKGDYILTNRGELCSEYDGKERANV